MRAAAIKAYALARAAGYCEFCGNAAPFRMEDGEPYLESHHILRLADEGPDHPRNVIGVCPNCHRRAHHAADRIKIKNRMRRRVAVLEARRRRD
jgi:5-methylcytosine-specific restriction protein A